VNQLASPVCANSSQGLNLGKFFLILFLSVSTIQQGLSMQIPFVIRFYNIVGIGTDFAFESGDKEYSRSCEALERSDGWGEKVGDSSPAARNPRGIGNRGVKGGISSLLSPWGK
jgi:hypothetical protein